MKLKKLLRRENMTENEKEFNRLLEELKKKVKK